MNRGVLVEVISGGPAEKAGIRTGDVIIAFDGAEVNTVKQLQRAVRAYDIGHETDVTVVRGNDTETFRVALEEQSRGL